MLTERKAGILMPIFSLPGSYGIGSLGREAFAFADFLQAAGQRYWQLLPLGPTGYGDSPYQSFSAFAGNPYLLDLEQLAERGLLTEEELAAEAEAGLAEPGRIDYGRLYRTRPGLLHRAYSRFVQGGGEQTADYLAFVGAETDWLADYARFMVRKEGRSEGFYRFLQFEFFRQWERLRVYVHACGLALIGDLPIYVAMDSADREAHPELFQLDERGVPLAVAGCPPDAFSESGQLWGNPLYDWDYHAATGYAWWEQRLAHSFRLFDVVRFDHFRGLESYYAIPYGAQDARGGTWRPGPGKDFVRAMQAGVLKGREMIAEDLGYLTDEVRALLAFSAYPGMKILEFAFDSRESADYLPHTWPENSVAYTGTHDNQTLAGWFAELTPEDRAAAAAYLGLDEASLWGQAGVRRFLELTLNSAANTVIVPLQDYLGLGAQARINHPATLGTNWRFRFSAGQLSSELCLYIRSLTEAAHRL